jgi:hypothetical protein
MEYKTIYATSNPAEMALIKHALITAEIPFRITNESLLNSLGIAGMGNSGADIMVEASMAEEAKELLSRLKLVNN